MKRNLFFIGLLIVCTMGICLLLLYVDNKGMSDTSNTAAVGSQTAETVSVGTTTPVGNINFEVVTTTAAQEQGLGGRSTIPDNYAMLFVFPQDGNYGFWMKDMLTSIDMVWVTDNGVIASITPSVSPATYPAVFYPPQPIRYVLETRAGFAEEENWKVGTHVQLPLPYGK